MSDNTGCVVVICAFLAVVAVACLASHSAWPLIVLLLAVFGIMGL